MMELKKKLILEDLEDEVVSKPADEVNLKPTPTETEINLTPEEEVNFHVGTISDLLNKDLELFNLINSIMTDSALKPEIHQVLESVSDDLAISIGKLQECLKVCSDDKDGQLINQGEKEVKNIIEEPVKEE